MKYYRPKSLSLSKSSSIVNLEIAVSFASRVVELPGFLKFGARKIKLNV